MYGKYIPIALAIVSDLVLIGECTGLPDEILPCRDSGSLKFMTPTRQPPVRVLHDSLSECQCTLDRVWHISHDAGESIRRLGLPFGHNNLGLADFFTQSGA